MGPDEYHWSVDDNAYTNVMAQWALERGAETASIMQRRRPDKWNDLVERLGLGEGELKQWTEIAQSIYTGFNPATRLFEQFKGYFALEDIDLAAYTPRTAPMDVLLGRSRIARIGQKPLWEQVQNQDQGRKQLQEKRYHESGVMAIGEQEELGKQNIKE